MKIEIKIATKRGRWHIEPRHVFQTSSGRIYARFDPNVDDPADYCAYFFNKNDDGFGRSFTGREIPLKIRRQASAMVRTLLRKATPPCWGRP